jgi:predicted O-methyltransferase YrrM
MPDEVWTRVDRLFEALIIGQDGALEAAVADGVSAGLPQIQVAPNQGKLLHLLARAIGARSILEIGTLGGYSTIWLARALPADGQLITLEINAKHAEVATASIERAGLGRLVDVRVGRALDSLEQLDAEGRGPFDLVFIDADKPSTADYFSWAVRLARPGALIFVDNVVRHGEIADAASDDVSVQGMRRFNDVLATETRVSATVIQTVGVKGYDGFALALVVQDP